MKVVIHIGMHKAASTSIQAFARNNRDLLERYGVVFPKFHHRRLLYDVYDYDGFTRLKNYAEQRHKKLWTKKIQDIYAETRTSRKSSIMFLSSETFENYAGSSRKFSKLLDWLSTFADEVEFMLVVRDQASFLNSQYCQHAKTLQTADDFDVSLSMHSKAKKLDYTRRFRALLDARQKIVVIPFPELVAEGVGKQLVGRIFGIREQGIYDELETPNQRNANPGTKTVAAGVRIRGQIDMRLNGRNLPEEIRYELRLELSRFSKELGWNATPFCGLDNEKARAIMARFAKKNNAFARAVWGADWSEIYGQRDDFSIRAFDFENAGREEQKEFEDVVARLLQRFDELVLEHQGRPGSHSKPGPAHPA